MSTEAQASRAPLSRTEWTLIALGLAAWLGLIAAGVWFVHQMTRGASACGIPLEARSLKPAATSGAGPRNALQLLAGTGKCPR